VLGAAVVDGQASLERQEGKGETNAMSKAARARQHIQPAPVVEAEPQVEQSAAPVEAASKPADRPALPAVPEERAKEIRETKREATRRARQHAVAMSRLQQEVQQALLDSELGPEVDLVVELDGSCRFEYVDVIQRTQVENAISSKRLQRELTS
jgi:hypothetical protein